MILEVTTNEERKHHQRRFRLYGSSANLGTIQHDPAIPKIGNTWESESEYVATDRHSKEIGPDFWEVVVHYSKGVRCVIDITKQYQTRDGNKVRLFVDDLGGDSPIGGAWEHNGEWVVEQWGTNGQYHFDINSSKLDLIPVPQYHTLDVWANLYPDQYRGMKVCYWNSKEQADRHRTEECIACIHITQKYQEGEGL